MARRAFRAKNLSVNVAPTGRLAQITERLKICVLHTHVCLGWTHCRIFTTYCATWLSWPETLGMRNIRSRNATGSKSEWVMISSDRVTR